MFESILVACIAVVASDPTASFPRPRLEIMRSRLRMSLLPAVSAATRMRRYLHWPAMGTIEYALRVYAFSTSGFSSYHLLRACAGLRARPRFAAARGRSQGHGHEVYAASRPLLSRHAAQLLGLCTGQVRCAHARALHDLYGWRRLDRQWPARAGGVRQSDRPRRAAAAHRHLHRSRSPSGGFRNRAEPLRARVRIRFP